MKKCLALLLTLLMVLASFGAQASTVYEVGDTLPDFTLTAIDGSTVTLSGLLQEKKAVVVNFWATWCPYCLQEFPNFAQAIPEYEEDIAFVFMTCEATDTADDIAETFGEYNISGIFCGYDDSFISNFSFSGIPTTLFIDRNQVLCTLYSGTIPTVNGLESMLKVYAADDYSTPVLNVTPVNGVESTKPWPDSEALLSALTKDAAFTFATDENEMNWPWEVTEAGIINGNANEPYSYAELDLAFTLQEDGAIVFDYESQNGVLTSSMRVLVDGSVVKIVTGKQDWTTCVLDVSAGTHTLAFRSSCTYASEEGTFLLRNLRTASTAEAADLRSQMVRPALQPENGKSFQFTAASAAAQPITLIQYGMEFDAMVLDSANPEVLLRIADTLDPGAMLLYLSNDLGEAAAVQVSSLPISEEGYVLNPAQYLSAETYYYVTVYPNLQDASDYDLAVFFPGMDALDTFLAQNYAETAAYGYGAMTVRYPDGTLYTYSPDDSAAEDVSYVHEDGTADYIVYVTDQEGNPVADVYVQICGNDMCNMLVTDSEGMVSANLTQGDYTVHILSVPEGYTAPAEEATLDANGGAYIFSLQ